MAVSFGCKQVPNTDSETHEEAFEPKGGMADLVHNPVRSDGTIDSSYLPILTWKEIVYDFGTILEGDIVSKEFEFTNTGTAPLLIVNASSTCGCTIPEWPKEPIQPGSTGAIKVKFNALDKMGAQHKVVTIFANTIPNTSTITIQGNVDLKN